MPSDTGRLERPKVVTDLLAADDTGTVANYIRQLEAERATAPSSPAPERAALVADLEHYSKYCAMTYNEHALGCAVQPGAAWWGEISRALREAAALLKGEQGDDPR